MADQSASKSIKAPAPSADLEYESELWARGYSRVAGMDEVGRGSLAGPVSVGVAIVPAGTELEVGGLIDSKALSPSRRESMVPQISAWLEHSGGAVAVGHTQPEEIDSLGMTLALRLAAQRALADLASRGFAPDAVLLDGKHDWFTPPEPDLFGDLDPAQAHYALLAARAWGAAGATSAPEELPVTMVIKGDYRCASIAAASVVAKVERDELMDSLDQQYPGYGWAKNKGYGSAAHRAALEAQGASVQHRLSWSLPLTDEQREAAYAARAAEEN